MSDDEVLRRRAPFAALVGIVGVVALAWYLYRDILEDYRAFEGFCGATHVGEPWEHVQERAAAKGWSFVRQSRAGGPKEEWLTQVELWSYRAGCVVEISRGRVVAKRFAELPD